MLCHAIVAQNNHTIRLGTLSPDALLAAPHPGSGPSFWWTQLATSTSATNWPDQIATLTQVRSLTARLFTAAQSRRRTTFGDEDNFGLAFRVILDWMDKPRDDRTALPVGRLGPFRDTTACSGSLPMTKAITATAAMPVIEQGNLSLDEPIGPPCGRYQVQG